jgi:hypothetical protein
MRVDRPRILMFAPLCYPPAGSEAIATAKVLLAMLDAGWEMDVISQKDFGHYYPANIDGIWKPITRIVHNIEGIKSDGIVKRLSRRTAIHKTSGLESISWSWKALCLGMRLFSKKKYDFILSRAAPQYGHLPALILSRWTSIPWIASWSDPMPPQKAPPPYGQGPSISLPIYLRKYCSGVARNAAWHIFPCERLLRYMSSYIPELAKRSSLIPHIALERFRTEPKARNENFSMCYIGSLTQRDPRIFLEGVKRFLNKTKIEEAVGVKFIGSPLGNLQEAIGALALKNIVSIEHAKTYEESQNILAESDVLVILEAPCEEGVFFPSKFVDLVQTGHPILAVSPVNGTLADILTANGGGIVADCLSPDAVEGAIKNLYVAWKEGSLESKYGSSRLFNLFGESYVIGQYLEIFSRIRKETDLIDGI